MSQRQILENSINLLNTARGPAKLLKAASGFPMPSTLSDIINATTGAPASGWTAFGLTRGGINVTKNLDVAVRDDVDQILGAYDQDITDRSYTITTQLAEVLDQNQMTPVWDMGAATQVVSATGRQEQMQFLDDGNNKTEEGRWAVVFPLPNEGQALAFVFRRAAISGGDKTFRFDKSDPVSPPLELRAFPEIATSIGSQDAYGRLYRTTGL
jgi:hypothetical protein